MRPPWAEHRLLLYGGSDHRKYLGCLNCPEYVTDSVFNPYGSNGTQYAKQSIWNRDNEYGTRSSNWGVCNPYASDPPIIVDEAGNVYGRLTVNPYHPQIGIGTRYFEWLQHKVCQQ
jgi:hypothetical protein